MAGMILLASLLLSACGPFTPLLTEKEVLSELSERYDGAEFAIWRRSIIANIKPKVKLYGANYIWLLRRRIKNVPFGCIQRSAKDGEAIHFPCVTAAV